MKPCSLPILRIVLTARSTGSSCSAAGPWNTSTLTALRPQVGGRSTGAGAADAGADSRPSVSAMTDAGAAARLQLGLISSPCGSAVVCVGGRCVGRVGRVGGARGRCLGRLGGAGGRCVIAVRG